MRNKQEFHYEYSMPPDQKAAQIARSSLEQRLDHELERCWREYKAEMAVQQPEWLFNRAGEIAATEEAYCTFCHRSGLTNEMMEKLLQFENPLEVLRDAWSESNGAVDSDFVREHLKNSLFDSETEQIYELRPEFSGRPVDSVQEQQMGGYDG